MAPKPPSLAPELLSYRISWREERVLCYPPAVSTNEATRGITDIHIHVQPLAELRPGVEEAIRREGVGYLDFLRQIEADPSLLLAEMDRAGIERVGLVNDVSPDVTGFTEASNDFSLCYAAAARERLLPIAGIHALRVRDPEGTVDRFIESGFVALKIHPPHQGYAANAYLDDLEALGRIYRRAEERRFPVMIHTGTSVFPGARSRLGRPIDVDDVAVDFPRLPILLAHGGRPLWYDEAFFVARRHPNIYLDLSGIPPRKLAECFPRLPDLGDRVLWGSDWPGPGVRDFRTNIDQFLALPFPDGWKERVLGANSLALFPA
ncbi:MAG: amidohydrolase [Candidatus Eisenbacteria bacterium]|nr:amidohydrolase [Candidatus Eisenbacteria bacterium]